MQGTGRRVLVTGATGVVGSEVVAHLRGAGADVVASSAQGSRRHRVTAWRLGDAPPPAVAGRFDAIVNCAASTRWTMTPEEARGANVDTVAALRPLASPGTLLVHLSTAFASPSTGAGVAGDGPAAFRNAYEWSKAESEGVAGTFPKVAVVRPPLVVGRRTDGVVARFNGIYSLLSATTSGLLPAVVGDRDARLELVCVDDVARIVARLVDEDAAGARVTLGRGPDAPTVGEVVERAMAALNRWRRRRGVEPVDPPPFVDPGRWDRFFRRFLSDHVGARHRVALELLDAFLPYLVVRRPPEVDEVVDDVLGPLDRCVAWWAEARPARAGSTPRPWSSLGDDKEMGSPLASEEGAA